MNQLSSNSTAADKTMHMKAPKNRELILVFFLFLAAALISLFFCSVHSPFYRFSNYPDANAYIGVARAMRHGLMPYRDVFDHKGVLLYLINYVAAVLFPKSMTGIYFLLSLSLAVFLQYGYRIARMLLSMAPALVATLSLLLFSVGSRIIYKDGGGSAEEYLMPCLMACLYYLILLGRYIEKESDVTARRFFFGSMATGFFCGVILWIKYTPLLAVGVAFLTFYVYLYAKKRGADALRSLLGVFLGIFTVSLPCLIFLWMNGLMDDAWSIYVVFNFKYLGGEVAADHTAVNINNLLASIPHIIVTFPGLVYLRAKMKTFPNIIWVCVLLFAILNFSLVLLFGRYYNYYFLLFAPFPIFATTGLIHFVLENKSRWIRTDFSRAARTSISGLLIVLILCLTVNSSVKNWFRGSLLSPKTNIEYCAESVNDYWASYGDGSKPKIVHFFTMDIGLSQLCGTYPQNRYFYAPNVDWDKGIDILDEQVEYIQTGSVDFIFTNTDMDFTDRIAGIDPSYRLICTRLSDIDVNYNYCVYAKDRTGGEP